jgi:hypothetical protein
VERRNIGFEQVAIDVGLRPRAIRAKCSLVLGSKARHKQRD